MVKQIERERETLGQQLILTIGEGTSIDTIIGTETPNGLSGRPSQKPFPPLQVIG